MTHTAYRTGSFFAACLLTATLWLLTLPANTVSSVAIISLV
jgi:hypothetical protein